MIRLARVADAIAVHDVLLAARDEIPLAENFEDDAHLFWVRNECRRKRVRLAEQDGAIAGVLVMRANEIFYLAIAPAFRRQGVGRALLQAALAYVQRRRWRGATARVRPDNVPIVKLLTEFGFAPHRVLAALRPGWAVYSWGEVR
ncbi:MAG: GNAT family N-acetyltransferase [Phenylobacterium sp.]|uniref:GNAT family N-acetyltransferase n=1 Tax=Phenylobacterium sp. TaxID=1871053 RepID=UPI003BB5C5D7